VSDAERPYRVPPRITDSNEHFWLGGADGELCFLRCQQCGYYIHPPAPICPECHSKDVAPEAVSGRAVVHTFTVNHQPWFPNLDPPYVVAIVEIEEQSGLRLTTNIFNCPVDDVVIGMPVRVLFEEYDGAYLPMFEPNPDRVDP
jgi:uncharacterized OB-fold protein